MSVTLAEFGKLVLSVMGQGADIRRVSEIGTATGPTQERSRPHR